MKDEESDIEKTSQRKIHEQRNRIYNRGPILMRPSDRMTSMSYRRYCCLRSLTTETSGEGDVTGLDGDTLGVDGSQVAVRGEERRQESRRVSEIVAMHT